MRFQSRSDIYRSQWTRAGRKITLPVKSGPGATATDYLDSATVPVLITPSGVEDVQFVDSATVPIAITPSAADTAQFVDSSTVRITITSSGVDTQQFADSVTAPVAITPSATESQQSTFLIDAATVSMAITPSSVDTLQAVDSSTVRVTITPNADFASLFSDSWLDATSNGWGTVDAGTLSPTGWTVQSGSTASNFSSGSGFAQIAVPTSTQRINAGVTLPTVFQTFGTYKSDVPGSSNLQGYIAFYVQDNNNYYRAQFLANNTGALQIQFQKVVAGSATNIGANGAVINVTNNGAYTAGDLFNWKLLVNAGHFVVKVWAFGTDEPTSNVAGNNTTTKYAVDTADDSTWSSGDFGLWGFSAVGGNINFGPIDSFPTAPGTDYFDSNTVGVTITPSALDVKEAVDAATVRVTLTPSSTDTAQYADASTASVAITPSTVETAQFVDTSTVRVTLDVSASVEVGIIHTDSATVPLTFTVSAVEATQFADTATVPVLLSPSSSEAAQYADAVSVSMKVTPSSADTAQYVESATIPVSLTPSSTEIYGQTLTDTGTVHVTLANSAQESAQFADAATVPVTITSSASEFVQTQPVDAATVSYVITASGNEIADTVDAVAVSLKITPSSTDVPERAFIDSAEIDLIITPITTVEDIGKVEVGTAYVGIVPSLLSEFQGEGDIVPIRITSTLVETFTYEDTNVILLSVIPDSMEEAGTTTTGDVYLRITPALAEIFAGIDDATILVSITPGVVFEVQQVADYLLVGVLSSKWGAVLRANTYAGVLFQTRYVVVDFDTRWHYHYRGRGDE